MNRIFTLFLLLCSCTFTLHSQIPEFYWGHSIGGPGTNWGKDILTDASGNSYVTGFMEGATDYDPSTGMTILTPPTYNTPDAFLAKYDYDGNFLWAFNLQATGTYGATGYSIAQDGNGDLIWTGSFGGTAEFDPGPGSFTVTSQSYRDLFVAKYDAAGNFIWVRTIGGTGGEEAGGVAIDGNNNVIIVGGSSSPAVDLDPTVGTDYYINGGNYDVFIVKLSTAGDFIWSRGFGGASTELPYRVATGPSNDIYIGGVHQGTTDFDPSAAVDSRISNGGNDAFICRFDASGNFQWVITYGGIYNDETRNMKVNSAGDLIAVGSFRGTVDFDPSAGTNSHTSGTYGSGFIGRYNASGALIWVNVLEATTFSSAVGLDIGPADQVLVAGPMEGTIDFDPSAGIFNLSSVGFSNDVYVAEYNSNGGFLDAFTFDGNTTGGERIEGISYDATGGPILTGTFGDDLDVDPSPLTSYFIYPYSSNSENMMLVRFGPPVVLAVPILSFTAHEKDRQILLDWEVNDAGGDFPFVISRSSDGTLWEDIHSVDAGQQAYSYVDTHPLEGRSFYRLQQADESGKLQYSDIEEVFVREFGQIWDIRPNPASGGIASVELAEPASGMLELMDYSGRMLIRYPFEGQRRIELPVNHIPAGIYFIVLSSEGKVQTKKLIIEP